MAGDQTPNPPAARTTFRPAPARVGPRSYLIGGMLVWGFIGWLVDQWLDTGGIATGIGVVLGMAGGIILVIRRLGTPT